MKWIPALAAAAIVAGTLTGCGAQPEPRPEVARLSDWTSSAADRFPLDSGRLFAGGGVADRGRDSNAVLVVELPTAATVTGMKVVCKGARSLRMKVLLSRAVPNSTAAPAKTITTDPIPCDEQVQDVEISGDDIRTVTVSGAQVTAPTGWRVIVNGVQK